MNIGSWFLAMTSQRHVWIASGLITLWFAGLAAALADDGTAHNGPHNVPGVIRAVDFNDGRSLVAYYATTPGNQGGYSGYRPDTDVDIANGPGGPYVISSADGVVSDWLKYTIEVSQAGWYRVDYFARAITPASGVGIVTLIDDRSFGDIQGVPVQDDFADFWPRSLHLGAGRHTLGVLIFTQSTALDRIQISPVAAPLALTPRIVPLVGPSSEVVVADAVVTDAPFLADPTGTRDSTQAFSDALAAVAAHGVGTVFAPAGIYRIDGTLLIPQSVTLRGADLPDRSDPNRIGTLLLASFGQGDETAASFISLDYRACVRDLAIWYPSQGFTDDTVRPYPFTVEFNPSADGASALNLLLYNSYDGISIRHGETHVDNIVGTVLHTGLTAGGGVEFSWLTNVRFDNDTWKSAPRTVISNAPASDEDRLALDAYTSSHVVGAQIGLNTYGMYGLRVRDARQGMLVKELPGDASGFSSVISRIDAPIDDVDGYVAPDFHFLNTDNVPGAENWNYEFVGFRSSPNATNFVRVTDPPFNAAGDGLADDTAAIQAALDAMGQSGGGTVYLPDGQYHVTRLTVPTGVELRGPLGGGSHPIAYAATCTLLGYEGKNTAAPASDPALVTLSPGSGIRGFNVVYPEQGYGSAAAPVVPYPFTIRGTGAGVWVENISVANAYNLIDLGSFRCDDHFVSGVEATVLNIGIFVGGGSEGGRLERVIFTFGHYAGVQFLSGPLVYGWDVLSVYTLQHAVSFVFGSCSRETTFGLDAYWFKIGWRMLADGGGCTDSTFWQSSSDTSSQAGFLFEGGDNLRFVGIALATDATAFVSSASFSGSVDVYGPMIWGGPKTHDLSGGVFHFHNEKSLTLGKSATASSVGLADEGPSAAIDGSDFTKWESATGGTNWLTVDLEQPSEIDRWVVRHAGVNGEATELDTYAFALQVSEDGLTFIDADAFLGNGGWLTDRPVLARGRFVRLLVTQGTLPGGDGRARIYEFEAHGKEGWQFTNDAEGWAPLSDVSSFAVTNGKLEISSLGGQPTIASPDNLNIPTSRFAVVRVTMRNSGAPTSTKLSFTTQADPGFSEAKSVAVGAVQSSPEYVDYYFDLSGNAGWTGTLRQLRLTPIRAAGDVSIDSIALEDADPHARVPVILPQRSSSPRVVVR